MDDSLSMERYSYIPITPTTTTLSSGCLIPTHTHYLALIICDSIRLPTTCLHCFFNVCLLAVTAGRLVKKREAKLFSRGLLFWKTGRITLNGWLFWFDSIQSFSLFWTGGSWLADWFFASSGVKDEGVLRFPWELCNFSCSFHGCCYWKSRKGGFFHSILFESCLWTKSASIWTSLLLPGLFAVIMFCWLVRLVHKGVW